MSIQVKVHANILILSFIECLRMPMHRQFDTHLKITPSRILTNQMSTGLVLLTINVLIV
ncbi:hypothetical protein SCEN_P00450 [Saccharomyces cerevisiae]|nr:hypothetical protein SCEN_P00450 [Saccharomyces cerevisiae]